MPNIQIKFKKSKDCKGSVRFDAQEQTPPSPSGRPIIRSIYVDRPESTNWSEVVLNVEGK